MEVDQFIEIFGLPDDGNQDCYIFQAVDAVFPRLMKRYNADKPMLIQILRELQIDENFVAIKDSYNAKKGTLKMVNGEKFSFDIKTFSLQKIRALDVTDEENNNTIIILNGFPLTAEQDDALKARAAYLNQTISLFKRLDMVALSELMKRMEPNDVLSVCMVDHDLNKKCNNETLMTALLKKHFNRFLNSRKPGMSDRQFYDYLTRILTRSRFNRIMRSSGLASKWQGYSFDKPKDLYDLLYDAHREHSWGVIDTNDNFKTLYLSKSDEYYAYEQNEFIQNLLRSELTEFEEGKNGRVRLFLEALKRGEEHDFISSELWTDEREFVQLETGESITAQRFFGEKFGSAENFIKSLYTTFEQNFQRFVSETTDEDIREVIVKRQEEIIDYESSYGDQVSPEEYTYDEDDREFLQILHTAIKNNTLRIFDPVDYDSLMGRK